MDDTKTKNDLDEHLAPARAPNDDAAYRAWKQAKVRRALKESKDGKSVPAEKVWRDLGLER